MKTSDFDYALPPELIAQEPLPDRAGSRMLVLDRGSGAIRHEQFCHLGHYLRRSDLLVLNDTRVLPARIWSSDPVTEFLLVEKLDAHRWSALVKPARRAKLGVSFRFEPPVPPVENSVTPVTINSTTSLAARVEASTEFGGRVLRFEGDVEGYLAAYGAAPLPPYIKRPAPRAGDRERYQTVFARTPGAIAAPTAGLHFTRELLDGLAGQGVGQVFVTLHVGLGTFRPVKAEKVEDHRMHAEKFVISADAAAAIRSAPRVVAVGTTVVRALESAAASVSPQSAKLRPHGPADVPLPSSTPILHHSITAVSGATDIFIRPPFEFRIVDALLTNFHLPRSTLLMLVSAFAGRELILRAYAEAVRERYRFFSYGDCMLIV